MTDNALSVFFEIAITNLFALYQALFMHMAKFIAGHSFLLWHRRMKEGERERERVIETESVKE